MPGAGLSLTVWPGEKSLSFGAALSGRLAVYHWLAESWARFCSRVDFGACLSVADFATAELFLVDAVLVIDDFRGSLGVITGAADLPPALRLSLVLGMVRVFFRALERAG